MNEIKAGAVFNYLNLIVRIGIGFLLSPFILYHLGVGEYGVYTVAGAIVGWLALADMGLGASSAKFLSEYVARGDKEGEAHYMGNVMALFSLVSVFILLAGGIIYFYVGDLFPKFTPAELRLYKILYLITLFNIALFFPLRALGGITTAHSKFVVPAIAALVMSLVSTSGIVVLLLLGYKAIAITCLCVGTGLIGSAWNLYYAFRVIKVRVSWKGWDIPLCKSLFVFSFWMFLDSLINLMNWGVGSTIIASTNGAAAAPVFSYGVQLTGFYMMAANCLPSLFLPKLVKMVQEGMDTECQTSLMIKLGRIELIVMGVLLLGIYFFGLDFFTLWIGKSLGEAVSTTWIVAVIMATAVTVPLIQCLGWQLLQARNAMAQRVKIIAPVAFANLVLGYFLSLVWGPIGLACSTALSFMIGQWFYMNVLYKKKMGLNIGRFFRETFRRTLSCCALLIPWGLALNYVWPHPNWLEFAAKVFLFLIAYLFIVRLFYVNKEELAMLPPSVRRLAGAR